MINANAKPSIAFFDFDGTITSKDTLAEIIKFAKGRFSYYVGLMILSPVIVAYKLKFLSNQKAKEILLWYFFKGLSLDSFNTICADFTKYKLPSLLRKEALRTIRNHVENRTKVVVVSASPVNWVKPWCDQYNIDCIATCLDVKDGKLTGKISGRNCSGQEKVTHITNNYQLKEYTDIYAYGDTPGDLPMLALSTHKFYKPFKKAAYKL